MGIFIIAEAGVNHNGELVLAKKLIDVASNAGCDAVKFQTFKAEKLVTKLARKAEYQIENTGNDDLQFQMLKRLELSYDEHVKLIEYCNKKGISFLSTPFDDDSADMLDTLGIQMFKIPSGEITNKPFLKHISRKQKPIILSTGMSMMEEVEEAINWIYEEGNRAVTLLHCTTNYPTDVKDVNLRAMLTLKGSFKVRVGYSDHTIGIEVPIAAAALGAQIIEKHFTLDKNMDGPDHKASLEPDELSNMVRSIRNIELALGNGEKKPVESEKSIAIAARKSIVAQKTIMAGEIITKHMLTVKRPGNGIKPKYLEELIGKKAVKDIHEDEVLQFEYFC